MMGFGMMMDDEEDEGGDQAAPPVFGDEDDEESLMVPSPQPHGEHKGSEHTMTPIVESPMQRNPMPFPSRSGSARALHGGGGGGGGTSGGSGTMDLTGGGDAAGEGSHTAVGSANQGAKPNPLLGTGGEQQERGFASKESLRSDPSKPAPPPMDARAIQAEASLAAEKDLTIAQQGHVVQNLEHNMDVLTASVADKEAKLKALQEHLDNVKRELNTQLARKDDELKQLRSVHKATIESMAAKATREVSGGRCHGEGFVCDTPLNSSIPQLMELKQAKRRVDVENRQLGQSIKLKEQQMSDMRALNKAATRNAAMLAMQRWCMRVQGRGLQRAWRVWLIATLKDKVRASRTRESAMATSMREAQTQLQMLMHNDWARELVRQGEEIKTLHQELEDAKVGPAPAPRDACVPLATPAKVLALMAWACACVCMVGALLRNGTAGSDWITPTRRRVCEGTLVQHSPQAPPPAPPEAPPLPTPRRCTRNRPPTLAASSPLLWQTPWPWRSGSGSTSVAT